jgi:hypothetical protein
MVYWPTIFFGLVVDDDNWWRIRKHEGFSSFKKIRNLTQLRRFIYERTYSGTTFGLNTKTEHLITIVLHSIICVLIYLDLGSSKISFLAALFYSVNPVNNQTSIWLNGRRYAINIILVLLMIACGKCGVFIYPLTFLFHVTAVFSPAAFWPSLSTMFFIIGFSSFYWKEIRAKILSRLKDIPKGELTEFHPRRIIVVIKTFGFYFFKILIPGVCAMQYPDLFYWGKTKGGNNEAYRINMDFGKGILALFLFGGMFWILPGNLSQWWLFMGLAILQWCNIIPVVPIADRYAGLPCVFMSYFLAYGLYRVPILPHVALYGIILGILAYYTVCLYAVMPMFKNLNSFWRYHIDRYPAMPWARIHLIEELLAAGRLPQAQIQIQEALQANSTDYGILMYAAIICMMTGKRKEALICLNVCTRNYYLGQEEKQGKEVSDMVRAIHLLNIKGAS